MKFDMLALVSPVFSKCDRAVFIFMIIGHVIVQLFRELNEYAESMIVLLPSQKNDGAGPLTVCLSPLTMGLVY